MSIYPPIRLIFGADVGSKEIVIACAHTTPAVKTIANHRKAIAAWLTSLPPDAILGMEATGRYHDVLAEGAARHGHRVYVINPKHLALYAKGVGQRGKTDPLDARVIARYVDREGDHLHPYTVPTATQRTLRDLLRLIAELTSPLKAIVKADTVLEKKRAALQTIVGVGALNSLALTHRFDRTPFANSDAVVAAYGMDPRPKDSGHKVGRRYLTKQGNAEDRRLIYLAAQSAAKTKIFKPLYPALRTKGFATTEAIVIIARKLLRIAFAVWTSNKPFDPTKIGFQGCGKP